MRLSLLFAPALLLAGCAGTVKNDSLTETLYAYQSQIRWGHFEDAAAVLDPELLQRKPLTRLDQDRYRQIQVSGYNAAPPVVLDEGRVLVTVELEYINVHRQTPRSIIDKQIWRYDEEQKRWWLTTGLPDLSSGRE